MRGVQFCPELTTAHLLTRTWRPPSVGRPSSQKTRVSEAMTGEPRPMDWLTMSSEEIGDAHAPPGASCFCAAAIAQTRRCRL